MKFSEVPIAMVGQRPIISAKINGEDAQLILDSGAFFSMMTSAAAAQYRLIVTPAPPALQVRGIGGQTRTSMTTVKVFTFAGIPRRNIEFLVGGSEVGAGAIGVLGQNFIESFDVEYDLAKGVVRLFKAQDCKHVMLAYWVAADQPMSMMDIGYTTPLRPHATGAAYLNGSKITVMFDTGAATSMLSLNAAARAGVKPESPGVVDAGYTSGVGRSVVKTYIANFSSFKIGAGEEIKNTRLRIADINLDEGDMLLGADFFLSHHIYISNSQHKVYFTYNGGRVFNLSRSAPAKVDAPAADARAAASNIASAAPAAAAPAGAAPAGVGNSDEPGDAAAFARRGAASAGRHDFTHAIADLTRAIELRPDDAAYFHERGIAYLNDKQLVAAKSDFDRALELNPDPGGCENEQRSQRPLPGKGLGGRGTCQSPR